MFSGADSYERFMGRWSRRLAPQLVRFAQVRDAGAVLDVGCGTGALAAAIAEAAPASRVVGVDRAAPYAAAARAHRPDSRVTFAVGDARHLPFADARVDRTLSLLILNFIPDPAKALAEMRRVTRPGGTVAAAVWDYGDGMEMLRTFWDEAVALDPAADIRDERHMPLCRAGELAALWRSQGMKNVADEALSIDTRFASFDDFWAPFLEQQGPAGAYVAAVSAPQRDALRHRLHRRLFEDRPDGPFLLSARAWAVRGTV